MGPEFITDFFEFQFLSYALFGTILLSLSCGVISPLVIARRQSFMVAAVAHSTLLGASISLAIFGKNSSWELFLTTFFITLIFAILLAHWSYEEKLSNEGPIGIFFTTTMGLGIIIHQIYAKDSGDLMGLLFGNILLISEIDLFYLFIILVLTFAIITIPFKKWIYTSFDPVGAKISGINTYFFHILFISLLTGLVVSAMKLAGVVLINTLLLVPGLFSLKYAKSVKESFLVSIIFSLASSIIGLLVSNFLNIPSGATLAVTHFFVFVLFFTLPRTLKRK